MVNDYINQYYEFTCSTEVHRNRIEIETIRYILVSRKEDKIRQIVGSEDKIRQMEGREEKDNDRIRVIKIRGRLVSDTIGWKRT